MIRNRESLVTTAGREVAVSCVEAGIRAADPRRAIKSAVRLTDGALEIGDECVQLDSIDQLVVVGAGKASGVVARSLESILGDRIDAGVIVVPESVETDRVDVVVGGHPVPSKAGKRGAERILDLVQEADESTVVLVLLSGGGSALLPLPVDGVRLESMQTVTEQLVASGATIHEINAVRKHLSDVKGGRLAVAASPARVIGVVLSDVVGDDVSVIASGPTAPDTSTFEEAARVLSVYDVQVPGDVQAHIEAGIEGVVAETPQFDDAVFGRVSNRVLASGWTAIRGAREEALKQGCNVSVLSSRLTGEAREVGTVFRGVGEECSATGNPISPPAVVISGGELTVTVRGDGRGGPNMECALSAALGLEQQEVCLVSVDTDGEDGGVDAAGAIVDHTTVADADKARSALKSNDSYGFLEDRNAVVRTGKTGTNVNDLHVLVVDEPSTTDYLG